jgi:hypothetical protein
MMIPPHSPPKPLLTPPPATDAPGAAEAPPRRATEAPGVFLGALGGGSSYSISSLMGGAAPHAREGYAHPCVLLTAVRMCRHTP